MFENNVMKDTVKYYVFVKNGYRYFDPQYLSAGLTTVERIFPVPEANAVGTLDEYTNGIAFIKFGDYGKTPECRTVAKDFDERIYTDGITYHFSSNFSESMIAHSMVRLVLLADIKTGEAFYADNALYAGKLGCEQHCNTW